jgi:hypothetical protein
LVRPLVTFGKRHKVEPSGWVFDAGGGKQHADRLRANGYEGVRTVAFGSAPSRPPGVLRQTVAGKTDVAEKRYAYKNLRAEMYGELSLRIDPESEHGGFALPSEMVGPQYGEGREHAEVA